MNSPTPPNPKLTMLRGRAPLARLLDEERSENRSGADQRSERPEQISAAVQDVAHINRNQRAEATHGEHARGHRKNDEGKRGMREDELHSLAQIPQHGARCRAAMEPQAGDTQVI